MCGYISPYYFLVIIWTLYISPIYDGNTNLSYYDYILFWFYSFIFFFNKSTLGTIPMAYKKYPCGSAS